MTMLLCTSTHNELEAPWKTFRGVWGPWSPAYGPTAIVPVPHEEGDTWLWFPNTPHLWLCYFHSFHWVFALHESTPVLHIKSRKHSPKTKPYRLKVRISQPRYVSTQQINCWSSPRNSSGWFWPENRAGWREPLHCFAQPLWRFCFRSGY